MCYNDIDMLISQDPYTRIQTRQPYRRTLEYDRVRFTDGEFSVHRSRVLTAARARVLVLGSVGLSAAESGSVLDRTEATVKSLRSDVFSDLSAVDMVHAVSRGFDAGVLKVEKAATVPNRRLVDSNLDIIEEAAAGVSYVEMADSLPNNEEAIRRRASYMFNQLNVPNMAATVTLCRLAGILPTVELPQ